MAFGPDATPGSYALEAVPGCRGRRDGRGGASWNRGFQAGNLRAEPRPDKGGSWAWGLSLLKTPNSGRETWLSLDIGAGGKGPCYTAPCRDRDTKNFMGTRS